uniref:Uncharacterized protein n=1 Tax=viral metagenome TaxID=1070528 RepID=A0A6C0H880_9ZZZZ
MISVYYNLIKIKLVIYCASHIFLLVNIINVIYFVEIFVSQFNFYENVII